MRRGTRFAMTLAASMVAIIALAVQASASVADGDTAPQPVDRNLYLHWDTDCGAQYLSDENKPDGGEGCSNVLNPLVATGQYSDVEEYPSDPDQTALPITLDATRKITGTITSRASPPTLSSSTSP